MYRIYNADGNYIFTKDFKASTDSFKNICEHCNDVNISSTYVGIIESLKTNNLLSEDYKLICCYCKQVLEMRGSIVCPFCGSNKIRIEISSNVNINNIARCFRCGHTIYYELSEMYYYHKNGEKK